MAQSFKVIAQLNEGPKAGKACDLAFHQITRIMGSHKVIPRVGLEFLYRKRHAPILGIDPGDNCVYLLALLQYLTRMLDAARP